MDLIIYGLCDPDNHEVRYIGLSKNGLKRPQQHTFPSYYKRKYPVSCWVKNLIESGKRPEVIIISREAKNWQHLLSLEIFYIHMFRENGARLLNLSEGGEGTIGVKPSKEAIQKRLDKMKGFRRSKESNQKTSEALKRAYQEGRKVNPSKMIIDQNGKIYPSIRAAARHIRSSHADIWRQLKGITKQSKGFVFKQV